MGYISTQDGSQSYFSEKFQEAYHSNIGAYTEALEKHVKATNLINLAEKSEIWILDVCFGLAYNSGLAIEKLREINPEILINIYALENDNEILKKIQNLAVPNSYKWVRDFIAKNFSNLSNEGIYSAFSEEIKIDLYLGDARESIKKLEDDFFDVVFFDPFSPKVCPELWTADFIKDVVDKAKLGAFISTYSSSRIAKDGFKKAGCLIFEGPKLNRRSGGVLAQKTLC